MEGESPSIPILPDSATLLGVMSTPTSAKDMPNFMKFRFLTPDITKLHSQMSNDNLDTPSIENKTSNPQMQRVSIDTPTAASVNNMVLGLIHPRSSMRLSSLDMNSLQGDETSRDSEPLSITPSRYIV